MVKGPRYHKQAFLWAPHSPQLAAPALTEVQSLRARVFELEGELSSGHNGRVPALEGVSGTLFNEDVKREFTGSTLFHK